MSSPSQTSCRRVSMGLNSAAMALCLSEVRLVGKKKPSSAADTSEVDLLGCTFDSAHSYCLGPVLWSGESGAPCEWAPSWSTLSAGSSLEIVGTPSATSIRSVPKISIPPSCNLPLWGSWAAGWTRTCGEDKEALQQLCSSPLTWREVFSRAVMDKFGHYKFSPAKCVMIADYLTSWSSPSLRKVHF